MLSSNQESSYRIGGLMEINKVSDHNNGQQPQPKKQIRRRLHTNKPYQESFMNMAEARREIVTALKFHRASMKQQQAAANHDQGSLPPELERMPIVPPPPPPPLNQESFNLVLPNQTLGLNLNFKNFNNLNTSIYYNPMPSALPQPRKRLWCKSLESIEIIGKEENGEKGINSHEDDDYWCYDPFEKVMEFPNWLINANETSCSQHIFDHQLSHDQYSLDPALPWKKTRHNCIMGLQNHDSETIEVPTTMFSSLCYYALGVIFRFCDSMDIGDIEGMDGEEWLA